MRIMITFLMASIIVATATENDEAAKWLLDAVFVGGMVQMYRTWRNVQNGRGEKSEE